ncbi:MAG: serine/threonine-protein kinase [Myxococcota bacterium]
MSAGEQQERIEPGQVVARGRYHLRGILGRGGLATVFRAEDAQTGSEVALKVLRDRYVGRPERAERLRREFEYAARVEHPAVIDVHEQGALDDGRPFFSMEMIEGLPLSRVLSGSGGLPFERMCRLTRAIAVALDAVHHAGIVHRDVKPANVLVLADDQVKLIDFGMAGDDDAPAVPAGHTARLTRANDLLGTHHYMAPEQVLKESPRTSMDVFALGVVMYEMLSSNTPYSGMGVREYVELQIAGDPLLRSAERWGRIRSAPAELAVLIDDCRRREPGRRPIDMKAVIRRLDALEVLPDEPAAAIQSMATLLGTSPMPLDETQASLVAAVQPRRSMAAPGEPPASPMVVPSSLALPPAPAPSVPPSGTPAVAPSFLVLPPPPAPSESATALAVTPGPLALPSSLAVCGPTGGTAMAPSPLGAAPNALALAPVVMPEVQRGSASVARAASMQRHAWWRPVVWALIPAAAAVVLWVALPVGDAFMDQPPTTIRSSTDADSVEAPVSVGKPDRIFSHTAESSTTLGDLLPHTDEERASGGRLPNDEGAATSGALAEPTGDPPAEARLVERSSAGDSPAPRKSKRRAPPRSAPSKAKPPSTADRCSDHRALARAAYAAYRWSAVLAHTRDASCWSAHEAQYLKMRTEALMEEGRWSECLGTGRRSSDPSVRRHAERCKRRLATIAETP